MADQHPAPGTPDAGPPADFVPPLGGAAPPPPPPPPPMGSMPPPPHRGPYAAAPRPTGPRGSIWLGLAIGILGSVLIYGLLIASSSGRIPLGAAATDVVVWLSLGWPVIVLVGGIVLAALPRTTRTGAGLLLSIGVVILVAGGLCVALLAGAGSGIIG